MKQNTSSNTGHEFKFKNIAKVWNVFVICTITLLIFCLVVNLALY